MRLILKSVLRFLNNNASITMYSLLFLVLIVIFFLTGKKSRQEILRQLNVTRHTQLTPKAKKLYRLVTNMRSRLRKKCLSVRRRLNFGDKFGKTLNHLFLTDKVNKVTANFIMSQVKLQRFKPRGRRFSYEDKLLALSVMKHSGKCYRYLSTVFALPSKKTLTNLLKKVPFDTGLNEKLFRHLSKRVERIRNEKHKYCVILFDEINLEADLSYKPSEDYTEGAVDFGKDDRRGEFATHGLLFMVRGIFANWKQPVAFFSW